MNSTSHLWVTVSNRVTQTVSGIGVTVVGLLLTISSRQTVDWSNGTIYAFLAGLLLLAAGLGMLLFGGKQIITVDSKMQRITIEHRNYFSTSLKHIRFDEIVDAYVEEAPNRDGGSAIYHIVVKLKLGEKVPLFRGFFDGCHNESITKARCQRLMQYVRGNNYPSV